jgi:hypothetical protein
MRRANQRIPLTTELQLWELTLVDTTARGGWPSHPI